MMLGIVNGIKPFRSGSRARAGRFALAGMVAALLCGCGYHLAGAGRLPSAMQATYLESSQPRSEFYASLSEALRQRGLMLVDSQAEAGARLIISQDSTGQRVLSVTARNIPREYEVFYNVTFSLEAGGEALMEPEALVARRNYTYDETEVLGKEREESQLRRALAEDLARRVVRRIEAIGRSSPPGGV
jgi:LPS-assembly lipoprotein